MDCNKCGAKLTKKNWLPSSKKIYDYICKKCHNEITKQWFRDNPEKYEEIKKRIRDRNRAWYRRNRQTVFDYYDNKCECCGETHKEFFSIDHINGDGAKHRREVLKGKDIYIWLIRNNFPEGFRILCMNCNTAIGRHGYCPHNK